MGFRIAGLLPAIRSQVDPGPAANSGQPLSKGGKGIHTRLLRLCAAAREGNRSSFALQAGSDYAERKYSPGVWPKVTRNAEINALGLS